MNADIKQYLKLKAALRNEQARIETRLAEIAKVLGGEVAGAVVSTAKRGGRRTFSAATKAKMAAAQQARWAKIKAAKADGARPLKASK